MGRTVVDRVNLAHPEYAHSRTQHCRVVMNYKTFFFAADFDSNRQLTAFNMDTKYSSISMSIANLLLLIVCVCTIPTQLLAQDASEPTHEWVVLIPGSEIGEDEGSFWGTEFGFNSKTGILYSFNATKVTAYNLIEGQKSTVPIDPPPLTRWVFTLDVQNNRFIAGRSGRGNLYAAPLEGGSWTQIGNGYNDGES